MLNEREVSAIAESVLRRTLGAYGFDHAEVSFGDDHDGEPSVVVDVFFREGAEVTPGRATGQSIAALSNALRERGDNRFPYLRHQFAGDEIGVE